MEEQASNNNLHNNESPMSEFMNSVGNLLGRVEYHRPLRPHRTPIDFDLIQQSYELVVKYESDVTLGDVIDCGEDPNDVDPWTIDPSDLEESDREVDGNTDWYSNFYVDSTLYRRVSDNYDHLWNHFKELKNSYERLLSRVAEGSGGEA
jgi:hypothetical protein